ncbi:MAG: HAMP domain-containing sensor histidine kinase [Cyanobacteriota bacterium]|nr:HAMP domain-containing sensor histidine kinase [Cyanobacteriota bacterium]
MSGRFFPSLLSQMWAELPLPEWLPGVGESVWQQALLALTQLWREAGQFGVVVSGPVAWLPASEWQWQPEWHPLAQRDPLSATAHPAEEPTTDTLRDRRWLFTADLSPDVLFEPGQTTIPLLPLDPAQQERFLLLISPVFCVIVAEGSHPHTGQPGIMLSFEPEVLQRAWQGLQARLRQVRPDRLSIWEDLLNHFPLQPPHPRVMARFSSLLLLPLGSRDPSLMAQLPAALPTELVTTENPPDHKTDGSSPATPTHPSEDVAPLSEAELLRALIHEIKTPLATIHTLATLILKRSDLPDKVRDYVEKIDRECCEQIDRFSLFFQATEIDHHPLHLQPTALVDLVHHHLPRWQTQVERRGSRLDLKISEDLPNVVSDPKALDTILTGIIDRIARSSPPGSRISAQLVSAGEQVKLQFQVIPQDPVWPHSTLTPLQAIGQWLVLQPDTGAISLSIPVTQTLFRALGGYLTVKQKGHHGEVFTIYLPRQL